jgi:hypothetical protein
MKKTAIIILTLFVAFSANAQLKTWIPEFKKPVPDDRIRTLVNPGASKGFYVSGNIGIQADAKQPFVMVGTSGAYIINDKFAIGLAGAAYSNDLELNPQFGRYTFTEGGYGGLLLEPIFFSNSTVHFTVPVVFGAGSSVVYELDEASYRNPGERFAEADFFHRNNYLMIEPGVNVELNVTRFMRLGFKASYVLTSDVSESVVPAPSIDGLQMGMNLRLGWY